MPTNQILQKLVSKYPELIDCISDIESTYFLLEQIYRNGGKLLICGNGGSASDSEHIVGELMKGFMSKRPLPSDVKSRFIEHFGEHGTYLTEHLQGALPAISLVSHSALTTAFANDVAADMMFAQQVYGYGVQGDAVIGLSTSGNSTNVIHALQVAQVMGIKTIGLTGLTGGIMKTLCDVCICVPWESTPDIQERHLPIYHALCIMLEEAFFG